MLQESHKPTILLVEDYEETRLMLRVWLERRGYRLVEAGDGEEAVELASIVMPDAILMDLRLPELNGIAATRRIRQHPKLCGVPVIVISALDPALFRDAAAKVGCTEYLNKPIDLERLEDLLANIAPPPADPRTARSA